MANNIKVMSSIKNFLERMKARDEDIPEELAQDALEMVEEVKDALCEDAGLQMFEKNSTEDEDKEDKEDKAKDSEETEEVIEKKVEDAMTKVLRKYGLIKDGSMESLDELEKKLVAESSTDEDGEEEVTEDPKNINDSARMELLRSIKPVIANVKDAKQRKILADSFAKAIGLSVNTVDYGSILSATKKSAQDSMSKIKNKTSDADYDFGMEVARRWNPHYKEEN